MLHKTLLFIHYAFPFCFTSLFFLFDPFNNNFTGILHTSISMYAYVVCMMWMISLYVTLYPLLKQSLLLHTKMHMCILYICILLTLFIPYDISHISAHLHLLFALCTFIELHYLLYYIKDIHPTITTFYECCLILAGGFVLTFSSITGISEWIFVIGLWISLTMLHSYKK